MVLRPERLGPVIEIFRLGGIALAIVAILFTCEPPGKAPLTGIRKEHFVSLIYVDDA